MASYQDQLSSLKDAALKLKGDIDSYAAKSSGSKNDGPEIILESTHVGADGKRGTSMTEARRGDEILYSGETSGYSPTVFSNANVMEQRIPQLLGQANNLPTYGNAGTMGTGDAGGQYEESFDEILGFSDKGKEKKKKDLSYREGTNIALPAGYWEETYGDSAPIMKELARMKQTSDRYTQDALNAAQETFEARRQEQQTSNAANLAQVKQALALGGSSRYAPISSAGIVSAQEAAGIKRISDIDREERAAVAEIRLAQQNADFELMEKKLGQLETIRSEKAKAFEGLKTAQIQASRDNALAGLIAQGVTSPTELLQALNYDESGNLVGDWTLEEITKSIKGLNEVGGGYGMSFKFDAKQIGPLLGAGFTTQDITDMQRLISAGVGLEEIIAEVPSEQQAAVRAALGVGNTSGSLKPGVGAADTLSEQMIRTRLFPKAAAILNKGQLSDADRAIIDERIGFFRDSGLSEQQILDVFSGWSADVDSPYNQSFRDIILQNDIDGQGVSPTLSRVGSLIASGNYRGAMNAVENQALASQEGQEGYMGKIPTDTYTQRIDRIKQLLKQGGVVGFVEGSFSKVLQRIKGNDAARIKAELTQLYQTFRKENAGVAVTPSEEKFLNTLFADINDTKGNFLTKLDVFQQGVLDRHNATRSAAGLPRVRVLDVLDPNERLTLYGNPYASLLDANSLDI